MKEIVSNILMAGYLFFLLFLGLFYGESKILKSP